jgi:zinc protease
VLRIISAIAVLCGLAAESPPTARAIRPAGELPRIAFEKYRLSNGLDVVLAPDGRLPQVAFELRFHVGAVNERPGSTGFAHLFEHLVFGATRHLAAGAAGKILDAAGATDGNGTTSFESTDYFFALPSHELELGLWIQAERLGYMLDGLDQRTLANQKDIVRNERRQRVENQPYGIVEEALYRAMFPAPHPFHGALLGTHADIQAATLDQARAFSKTYYRPNNATLVLVGDFEVSRARQLVERYFGSLSPGPPAPAPTEPQPVITSERRLVVTDLVQLPRVYLGWHTAARYQPRDAALVLAASILADGPSSRLDRRLVREMALAESVTAEQRSLAPGSIFSIEATARPGKKLAELEKVIDEELARLAATPPSPEELLDARNRYETAVYERLEKLVNIAERLARYNHLRGDPGFLSQDIARFRAVTPEDVSRVVAAQLTRGARVVVHGVPGEQRLGADVATPPLLRTSPPGPRESVNAPESWRIRRPRPGRARPMVLPVARSLRLPNGLTLVHVPNPGVPLVSAVLSVAAGSKANPPDLPELASFTAAALREGTWRRSALQLAAEVGQLGASLETGSGADDSHVSLTCMTRHLPAALELLVEVALAPAFGEAGVERLRQERLGRLLQRRQNAGAVADAVSQAALFGPGHPLGKAALTESALKKISRQDLIGFWSRHYRPDQAALVVAGDITWDQLHPLVASRFGGWRGGAPPERAASPAPAPTAARLVLVDRPGAAQTALQGILPAPTAGAEDEAPFRVMNALLEERLMDRLRRDKGYTYGVQPIYFPARDLGTVVIRSNVRTEVTGSAVRDMLAEIERLRSRLPSLDELRRAHAAEVFALPSVMESNARSASRFAAVWLYGEGLDHYQRLIERLAAVDATAAAAMARKYLHPAQLILVVVGDRAKLAPQLAPLHLPMELRDAEGKVLGPN